ncbi:MAG: D-alanine--D-alanine ligase [Candidatus Paceibacterota bacterium]
MIRVGVLRGGPSDEYEVSLLTGRAVLDNLPEEKYQGVDFFIDRKGTWHQRGIPVDPSRVLGSVDTVFIGLHGTYGEDGQIQRMLEELSIPFVGSTSAGSALAMNKAATKRRVQALGIKTPHYIIFEPETNDPDYIEEEAYRIFRSFPHPCVTKPLDKGSSVGVTVVRSFHDLADGIEEALKFSPRILIEEFISGREAASGVLEGYRGESIYKLPCIEIVPSREEGFFTYKAKYKGASEEICPSTFEDGIKSELEEAARAIHEELSLRHYSRSDFIVSPRGVYFLETNTLPGLTPMSLLPKSVGAVGCGFGEFLDHLVELSLKR